MNNNLVSDILTILTTDEPNAVADIRGSNQYPDIAGTVYLYQTPAGVIMIASVMGLPGGSGECDYPVLAMHMHNSGECAGTPEDPFAYTGEHFNKYNCPHPYHSGDMPPLFVNNGYALSAFLTDRFTVEEAIGKPIVIHYRQDDFTTQPTGSAGARIACGLIGRYR